MEKSIVLATVFLDILWIGIMIPIFPNLVDYYHVSALWISLGITAYSFFAFFASPVLGQWSDKYGRKPLLLACVLGSALSYGVLIFTQNIWMYLLSRAINGITWGNISILQAIMSDISKTPEERKVNFWLIGALFGAWFIIGPLVGAFLVPFGITVVFLVGFLFAGLESLFIAFFLKETHLELHDHRVEFTPFALFKKYSQHPHVNILLLSFFILGLAMFVYQAVLTLYLDQRYQFPGEYSWYLLAAVGVMIAINQVVLMPKFWLKNFSSRQLMTILHIALVPLFIALAWAPQMFWVVVLMLVLTPFQGLINPIYQADIIGKVDRQFTGEINGLLGWIWSLTMFIGPLIGGVLLAFWITPFGVSAAIVFVSAGLMAWYFKWENTSLKSEIRD